MTWMEHDTLVQSESLIKTIKRPVRPDHMYIHYGIPSPVLSMTCSFLINTLFFLMDSS